MGSSFMLFLRLRSTELAMSSLVWLWAYRTGYGFIEHSFPESSIVLTVSNSPVWLLSTLCVLLSLSLLRSTASSNSFVSPRRSFPLTHSRKWSKVLNFLSQSLSFSIFFRCLRCCASEWIRVWYSILQSLFLSTHSHFHFRRIIPDWSSSGSFNLLHYLFHYR